MRTVAKPWLLLAVSIGLASTPAAAAPERIEVSGQTLSRVGQAEREELLIDLYKVTLYLPDRHAGAAHATRMDHVTRDSVPKAFLVEITYDGNVPNEIPESWSEELLPPLPAHKDKVMRQTYEGLKTGDKLLITYRPGEGTSLKLNGETFLSDPGSGLMAGFVDVFLGPDPVSDDVREGLLARTGD